MEIHNCHTHIFTNKNVPDKFLPGIVMKLGDLLKGERSSRAIVKILKSIGKPALAMQVKKYNSFINIGNCDSQLQILQHQQGCYPSGTKFVALTMDMEFMQAGVPKQLFEDQLRELSDIKKQPDYKDILYPFIFVHPERKNIFDLVRKYIEEHNFSGLKLYPPLGYYPFDDRLNKVFEYAQQNSIPIISHCSRGGVFYKGKVTPEMCIHPITGEKYDREKRKYFTDCYTDPSNYKYLLEKFPKLKVCLAHFGGGDEWKEYLSVSWQSNKKESDKSWYAKITELIKEYENVYTDISYTLAYQNYFNLLKVALQDETIRKKVLYGSDFYMLEQEFTEREFSINLRAFLGDNDYRQIVETNPKVFLESTFS